MRHVASICASAVRRGRGRRPAPARRTLAPARRTVAGVLAVALLAAAPGAAGAAEIRGTVTGDPGNPHAGVELVAGATVTAVPAAAAGDAPAVATSTADASGTYALTGLPAGEYVVRAEHPGYVAAWLPNVPDRAAATVLALAADDTRDGQQILLRRAPQPPPQVPIFDVIATPAPLTALAVKRGAKLTVDRRTRRVNVPVRCAGARCTGTVRIVLAGKAGQRAGKSAVLCSGDAAASAATKRVQLRLSVAAAKRVRAAGKAGLRATVQVGANAAAAPAAQRSVRLRLK